jgi:ferritin-like metal-binding protein YciE
MSKKQKFEDVSVKELKDLFSAEKQLFKMEKAAFSISLQDTLAGPQLQTDVMFKYCESEDYSSERKSHEKLPVK